MQMNSIFDPQYAVGGGQPRGFDQWSALYANYRVHGVKITVYAQSLTPSFQSIVSITPKTIATLSSNVKELMEQPNTFKCVFTSDRPCVFTKYLDCARHCSVTKKQYNTDDLYWAGIGGNPGQLLLAHINWCNINETDSTGHNIRVTATYYVEFFKPYNLAAS